jgi:2-hydroxy-3-keto-5-methylthiopentenyl-1-phosphate phosphatase
MQPTFSYIPAPGAYLNGSKPRPAVVCDFDDTTAIENVALMLLEEFGGPDWRDFQKLNSQQIISLKEYQERAFATIKVDREAMKALVKERATLRPQFRDLYQYCQARKIPLVIATLGLDFYVEALLEREGLLSIPYYAADTQFSDGAMSFGYRYTSEKCWQPGNCKCLVLDSLRSQGHNTILYAGDGKSDICPAMNSDLVFARRYLEEHFLAWRLPFIPLDDFSPVLESLKALTGGAREAQR